MKVDVGNDISVNSGITVLVGLAYRFSNNAASMSLMSLVLTQLLVTIIPL